MNIFKTIRALILRVKIKRLAREIVKGELARDELKEELLKLRSKYGAKKEDEVTEWNPGPV